MTDPSLATSPELIRSEGWDEEEYLALESTHARFELIDGGLWVSPGPTWPHQTIILNLAEIIRPLARAAGLKASTGINVHLAEQRILIPDLVVADTPKPGLLTPATDVVLIGEVTSPSNAVTDRHLKPMLYAEAGIPWYLTAEPDFHNYSSVSLELFRLSGGKYVSHTVAPPGKTLTMTEPLAVTIDTARLLAD